MMTKQWSSTANSEVKRLVRLQRRQGRLRQGRFLAEGRRIIDGFLAAGWTPQHLLVAEGLEIPAVWPLENLVRVTPAVIERLSSASTPSGYLAEFCIPESTEVDAKAGGLILGGLGDPGNVGTLIRTAAAFALPQVVLLGGADPYAPKVVQASAGGLAMVSCVRVQDHHGLLGGAPLLGLTADAAQASSRLPDGPCWLLVGAEAHGLTDELVAACQHLLHLPMPGGMESLNAATAGAIAAFMVQGLHKSL